MKHITCSYQRSNLSFAAISTSAPLINQNTGYVFVKHNSSPPSTPTSQMLILQCPSLASFNQFITGILHIHRVSF
jgi:hypothetical protein